MKMGKDVSKITIADVVKYSSTISDEDKKRIAGLSKEAFSYKIQDVYDVNDYNGFYACLIDTGNGEKAIGIRGSEDISNRDNFRKDWVENDFGLLQNKETSQQKEVRYMMEYYKKTGQLEDCEKLTVSGHSLGGNLASHAALVLTEDGFEDLYEKLDKVYNLDGPGVSQKYLEAHSQQIEKVANRDIIQHPKWSVVGNLLFEIPNSFNRQLEINEQKLDKVTREKKPGIIGMIRELFGKHSTVCVTPENNKQEEWELKDGKEDGLSKFLGKLSRSVDVFVPEPITYSIGAIASWIAEKILVVPENTAEKNGNAEVLQKIPNRTLDEIEEPELAM